MVTGDGKEYRASIVGSDPDHDLAVLRIKAPSDSLAPVPVGSSSNLQVGQKVLAIGKELREPMARPSRVLSDRPRLSPCGSIDPSNRGAATGCKQNHVVSIPRPAVPGEGISKDLDRSARDGEAFQFAVSEEANRAAVRRPEGISSSLGPIEWLRR